MLNLAKKLNHVVQMAKEDDNPLGIRIKRNIDRMLYLYD